MIPKKLASQMILLVLFALFSTQIIIYIIFVFETDENDVVTDKIRYDYYHQRMHAAVKIIENSESNQTLYSINSYRVKFDVNKSSYFSETQLTESDIVRSEKLRKELNEQYPTASIRQLKPIENRLYAAMIYLKDQLLATPVEELKSDPRNIILQSQVQLKDGRWLGMIVYDLHVFPIWIRSTVQPMALFSLIFIIFAVLVVKRITSPLAELADKANKLGKGHIIQAIEPRGPEDVQNAITAFNTMHKRISNVNDHRAKALAAISHDIRTPLTSMRLNAEYITDLDVQQKIFDKIAEMEQICEATVTFALRDSWAEKDKSFDIVSLIESLCCDFNEQEMDVTFIAESKIPFTGRPIALKRAFSNLIKNGVEYGQQVTVFIVELAEAIEVHIQDEGEGIKNADKQRLFEPFERVEQSRNRHSGGLGLGMAIARSVVRSHGGEIELNNRSVKGLDVVVILPF